MHVKGRDFMTPPSLLLYGRDFLCLYDNWASKWKDTS